MYAEFSFTEIKA